MTTKATVESKSDSVLEKRRLLNLLWREKFTSQHRRQQLVLRKVTWIISLFAVSAIKLPLEVKSQDLLYLIPFIALVFDLYIIGESFGIRRFARHVRDDYAGWPDGRWEHFMVKKRDPFSMSALAYSSAIILAGAAWLLFERHPHDWRLYLWAALALCIGAAVHLGARRKLGE